MPNTMAYHPLMGQMSPAGIELIRLIEILLLKQKNNNFTLFANEIEEKYELQLSGTTLKHWTYQELSKIEAQHITETFGLNKKTPIY